MIDKLRRLAKHSAVYGLGDVLNRAVGLILVPLYTNVLRPEEYGLMTLNFVFIAFASVFCSWGLNQAFLRFYVGAGSEEERYSAFTGALVFILPASALVSSVIWIFSGTISANLFGPHSDRYVSLIKMAAAIIFFDALSAIPILTFRAEEKSVKFVAVSCFKFILTVILNLYFVLVLKRGLEGIFESSLSASAAVFIVTFPVSLRHLRPGMARALVRDLLSFGLPFIPVTLSTLVIELSDRYMLGKLAGPSGLYQVGLYSLGYKLGVVMLLFVRAFGYAWTPFSISISGDSDAKETYSRVMTYFLLLGMFLFLCLSLFAPEVIRAFANPGYVDGAKVVPVILLSYLCYGVYVNLMAGVYIEKRTSPLPFIVGGAASVNLLLNFILIPRYGMMGAAYATLMAYMSMAFLLYAVVRRFYRISYEYARLAKLLGVGLSLWYLGVRLSGHLGPWALILKLAVIALFPAILAALRFFRRGELGVLKPVSRGG